MTKKSKKSETRAGKRRNRNESIREPILGYPACTVHRLVKEIKDKINN